MPSNSRRKPEVEVSRGTTETPCTHFVQAMSEAQLSWAASSSQHTHAGLSPRPLSQCATGPERCSAESSPPQQEVRSILSQHCPADLCNRTVLLRFASLSKHNPHGGFITWKQTTSFSMTLASLDSFLVNSQPSSTSSSWENKQAASPGHQAYLLINCSNPCLRSSMKDSSKMPSSPRNGSCRFKAFPGSGGTTI